LSRQRVLERRFHEIPKRLARWSNPYGRNGCVAADWGSTEDHRPALWLLRLLWRWPGADVLSTLSLLPSRGSSCSADRRGEDQNPPERRVGLRRSRLCGKDRKGQKFLASTR